MPSYTKRAIRESFIKMLSERPLDKISIKDIIEDCELNRSTFYYYYEDIYALLEDVFQNEITEIAGKQKIYDSWQAVLLEAADFVLQNKKAVYNIFNSMGRERLENFLYKLTRDLMVGFVNYEAGGMQVDEDDIVFIAEFYEYALAGFLIDWMQRGMKEDPHEMIFRLGQIFDGSIKNALLKCDRKNKV